MTKSFSLSVLVPALSALTAIVPLVVWLGFDTLGRQGVSALPALFPAIVTAAYAAAAMRKHHMFSLYFWWLGGVGWHVFLWHMALTQSPDSNVLPAIARVFSEWLYRANPAILASLAGAVAALGLMMTTTGNRGARK